VHADEAVDRDAARQEPSQLAFDEARHGPAGLGCPRQESLEVGADHPVQDGTLHPAGQGEHRIRRLPA